MDTEIQNVLLLTPNLDGMTQNEEYICKPYLIQIITFNGSNINNDNHLMNNLKIVKYDFVIMSISYLSSLRIILAQLKTLLPNSIYILCGSYFAKCIFPITQWEFIHESDFHYVISTEKGVLFDQAIHYHLPFVFKTKETLLIKTDYDISEPTHEISHLSFNIVDAIKDSMSTHYANLLLQDNLLKDHILFIAALPKSASSVFGDCISIMTHKIRKYGRYMLNNQDSDLRPEIILDILEGGIVKYHTSPTGKNLRVLEFLKAKFIILIRDPIDQIVGQYCELLGDKLTINNDFNSDCPLLFEHIYPIEKEIFNNDMDTTLNNMIQNGYLFHTLIWIVDWLRFRDISRSLIIKYEDLIMNLEMTCHILSNFILSSDCSPKTIEAIKSKFDLTNKKKSNRQKEKYPHGWTGEIGIWKKYFSENNKKAFIKEVTSFLKIYPKASLLLEYYPNLLDI